MPDDFVAQVALRYIAAYEKLTGASFVPGEMPQNERIARNLETYQSHSLDGAKRQS